jgi:fatty-acyl-CoA synthase
MTYAELHDRCARASARLARLGVGRGSRVALICSNRPEFLEWTIGALALGAVVAPLNTWAREWDLDYMLRHSRAEVLVTLPSFRDVEYLKTLDRLGRDRFPLLREVVVIGEDEPAAAAFTVAADPADVALVLYTSGSSARPKAVALKHGDAIENGFNIGERMGLTAEDRVWLSAPLFWAYGAVNALLTTLTHGATLVLQETFEPGEALALFEDHACTAAYLLPVLTRGLASHPARDRSRLSTLRTGLTIGGPEDVRLAVCELGIAEICNIYGSTETYGNCCVTPHDLPVEERERTQGPPLPGVTLRIVDDEILVKGYVSPGYVGGDGAIEPIVDGDAFFHTGDSGYLDEHGRLRFVARLDEMIKRGGANVSPIEVEDFLSTHPGVQAAAVVGAPHDTLGEVPVAFVVASETTADKLSAFCRERLAGFKVPASFHLVEELPTTATGKLDRRALAELVRS